MLRSFVHLDEGKTFAVHTPYGPQLRWETNGRRYARMFDSHDAALTECSARIQKRLDAGFVEVPRFRPMVGPGEESFAIRPPLDGRLTWREGVDEHTSVHDDLTGAVLAYADMVTERLASGFRDLVPAWHDGLEAPADPHVEQQERHAEPPQRVKRRFYAHGDDEFGPEWWFLHEGGALSSWNFQVRSKLEGPKVWHRPSGLLHIQAYFVRGLRSGLYLSFHPNGRLSNYAWFHRDFCVRLFEFDEAGSLVCRTLSGRNADGKMHGDWEQWEDGQRTLHRYEHGERKVIEWYRRDDDTLDVRKTWLDGGRLRYEAFHPGGDQIERRGVLVDERRVGPWWIYHPDGQPEQTLYYREPGALAGALSWSDGTAEIEATDGVPFARLVLAEGRIGSMRLDDRLHALAQEPSIERFSVLCDALRLCHGVAPDLAMAIVPELVAVVASWPERTRCPPADTIGRLVRGELPYDWLRLCKALSITDLMAGATLADRSARREAFVRWCQGVPDDGEHGVAWLTASTEFRWNDRHGAPAPEFWLGADELEPLLGSALCRGLVGLDLSLERLHSDPYAPSQDDFDGRGLNLTDVARALPAAGLEQLNLYGQLILGSGGPSGPLDTLSELRVLDVGGGMGLDVATAEQIARLPSLEVLHLGPSWATDFAFIGWDALSEQTRELVAEYWSVSDEAAYRAMRPSVEVIEVLLRSPTLTAVYLDARTIETPWCAESFEASTVELRVANEFCSGLADMLPP